jgi:N-acetylneuraminic acid mutarotase
MIVWGGLSGSYLLSGGQYDPVGDSWTATSSDSSTVPTARFGHTAVWTGSRMIVWGGYNPTQLATGGQYDPVGNSWTATTTAGAPSARDSHTAVWTGTKMIVWGGENGIANPLNTGGQYSILSLYVKN